MTNQPDAPKTSRKTLVTLVAIIALVLGGVAGGAYFAVQGLSGMSGKPLKQVTEPWLVGGTESAFATAMIKRNDTLVELADLVLQRSENETLRSFAENVKATSQDWTNRINTLLDEHGVERKTIVDSMSFHYKSLGELKTELETIDQAKFDLRFVAGMNVIARMEAAVIKNDAILQNSAELKAISEEITTFSSNIGPALGNWNK